MAFTFNGIPSAEVTIQGGIKPDYSDFVTVGRNSSSGTLVSTVPANYKWIIVSAGATFNGASEVKTTDEVLAHAEVNGYSSGNGATFVVLTAGQTITITRTGYFTYQAIYVG